MFHSAIRSARASSSVEKYSFRYVAAPPRRAVRSSLPEPWPITSCIAVSMSSASSPYFVARAISSGDAPNSSIDAIPPPPKRVAAAEQQEVLCAVLLVDFVLVRQVVADRRDVEVAGLDEHFDRLDDRRLERLLLVLRVPRRLLLEVGGVLRELHHRVGHGLSVIVTKLCDVPLAPRASR